MCTAFRVQSRLRTSGQIHAAKQARLPLKLPAELA